MTMFMVKERGRYRVRSMDAGPSLGVHALRELKAGRRDTARKWLDWALEARRPRSSSDLFAADLFAELWAAAKKDGSKAQAELAAAALAAEKAGTAPRAKPILLRALKRAKEDRDGDRVRLTLARIYGEEEDWERLVPLARSLYERHRVPPARGMLVGAYVQSERVAEARALLEAWLEERPRDPRAMYDLGRLIAAEPGQLAEGLGVLDELIEHGDPTPGAYNEYAWISLFADGPYDHVLERAEIAAKKESRARLHTLATVYAELDRPAEAISTLLKAIPVAEAPLSHDWYVIGRAAETYGLEAAARRAYERVEPSDDPFATYKLAQRRIARLPAP